ncbi:isopeptide-forming domain-containing fimbrial protein [Bifidobacterium gallicum]|nr:isopeptide-forming domain-containing fimbrial protein [Bifidobacterium gallicum]KFI59334.1 putative LPXTG-motif protein cell wall anchor domain protein [Bifidobacterium gallicum DSM 20093 = LMG 11596]
MNKLLKGTIAAVSGAAFTLAGLVGVNSALAEDAPATAPTDSATTATTVPTISGTPGTASTTTSKITVKGAVAGGMIEGYRLLNIESQSGDSFIYLVNPDYKAAIINGINAVIGSSGTQFTDAVTDAQIIEYLTKNLNDSNIKTFATGFMSTTSAPTPSFEQTDATKTITAQVGYYLFNQTATGDPTGKVLSNYMVDTLGAAPLTITLKNGTVTLTKQVKDNDTNEDASGAPTTSMQDWVNGADYGLGDEVPFKLTGTLPSTYSTFTSYSYTFTDTLSDGLTLDPSTVKVYAVNGTGNAQTKTQLNGFTVSDTTPVTTPHAGNQFTISTNNLKVVTATTGQANVPNPLITADTKIVVEYEATLNENAVIGNPGNPNYADLTFSSSPNVGGAGSTGTTPEQQAVVFTYELDITKEFQGADGKTVDTPTNDMPQFTLYAADGTTEVQGPFTVPADDRKLVIKDLDTGTYILKETKTPAGFNKADDVEFTIKAVHGTDSGAATITELTVSQAGWNADPSTGIVSGAIVNSQGTKLPSTGGMGTTLFYVAGAVIVAAAVAGLVIALRRRNNA